jgi:uncharacterized membrane protein
LLAVPLDAELGTGDALVGQHDRAQLARIGRMRLMCVALLVSLIGLGVAWELWLAPLPGGRGTLALKVLPLTFAIAGLLKHKLYTYRWLSLLIWLYFTEGAMRAFSDATPMSQALAGIELGLSAALFTACAVYVRLRLKVLPPKARKATKAPGGEADGSTGA